MGAVLPGQNEPAGHAGHENDAPAYDPVPGGHGSHELFVVPDNEKKPLTQFDGGVTPTRHDDCLESAYEPTGHELHVDDATAA
jgi:hypothetical protein